MPADAAELDVDDAAGTQLDRGGSVMSVVNGFVEANGGANLRLQFSMIENIVPGERLFDHHEIVGVEFPQVSGLVEAVRRICIDHELNGREALANRSDKF